MARKLFLSSMLLTLVTFVTAQSYTPEQKKKTQDFILKVLSEYKNPMSYYPLRRDIFLPSEEETVKDEMKKSYPEGARSLGHIIFLAANDTTYQRESFVDADGDLLELSYSSRRNLPSLKSNSSYFRRRQLGLLNRYPRLGHFLYYNATFGPAN